MNTVSLLTKVYGPYKNRLLKTLKAEILASIEELEARITKFEVDSRHHLRVGITGEDEEFIANHLTSQYGRCLTPPDIEQDAMYDGTLLDVGSVGFGLFVDIGIDKAFRLDPLIPLHRLRDQVKANRPLREISRVLCLVDHLPLDIKINHVDLRNSKIEAELGPKIRAQLSKWTDDDHERLLVFGANRSMIKSALKRSGHLSDIYEYEELGYLETSLVCKRSTRASGIVAAIGPRLKGIPIHLFIPTEIGAWLSDKT